MRAVFLCPAVCHLVALQGAVLRGPRTHSGREFRPGSGLRGRCSPGSSPRMAHRCAIGLGGERRTRRSGSRRGRPHHRRPVRRDWTRGVHQRLSAADRDRVPPPPKELMPTQPRPSAPRAFAGHPGADTEGGSLDVLTHLDQPGISTARQEVGRASRAVLAAGAGVFPRWAEPLPCCRNDVAPDAMEVCVARMADVPGAARFYFER